MSSSFFEQIVSEDQYLKLKRTPYNPYLRISSLQIALSVPDIEARLHALSYFIAEEKDYCLRYGLASSEVLGEANILFNEVQRRVQLLKNVVKMSDIYCLCEKNVFFEQKLSEFMSYLAEKPLKELTLAYVNLRAHFVCLNSKITATNPSI